MPDQLLFADQAIKGCDECPDPAGGVRDSCADTRTLSHTVSQEQLFVPFFSQPNPEGPGARPPASPAKDADSVPFCFCWALLMTFFPSLLSSFLLEHN